MAEIKVSSAAMRDKAARLDKIKINVTNYMDAIKNEMTRMQSGWEGTAAQTYVTKFNGLQKNFQNIYDVISKYSLFLKNAADEWDKLESNNQRTGDGLA